jgi:hypothetical protein
MDVLSEWSGGHVWEVARNEFESLLPAARACWLYLVSRGSRRMRHQLEETVLRLASFCGDVSKSVWHENAGDTEEKGLE